MKFILKRRGMPGKCPSHLHPWTPEEDELLMQLHGKKTYQEIADILPRQASVGTVTQRVAHLRRKHPDKLPLLHRQYTKDEERFIRTNAHIMTSEEIGKKLGRPAAHIRVKASDMGVSLFKCGELYSHTKYSDHDVELIRALHDDGMSYRELAEKFEISISVAEGLYRRRLTAADAYARGCLLR